MRKFYLGYKNLQTVSAELSWSHYVELIGTEEELARGFYEKQCIKEKWSVRELNCAELLDHDYITVRKVERDPSNGRPSFNVKISESGRAFIAKKEK